MNIKEYVVETIFNICIDSLNNIDQEEWNTLNNNINNYLKSNNFDINNFDIKQAFCIKPDEKDKLRNFIDETFNHYPLIETFFDNNRDFHFPEFNMIEIIKRWCEDIVEEIQHDKDNLQYENEDEDNLQYENEDEDNLQYENEDEDNLQYENDEYITINYFQGFFVAIYEMFMNREI